MTEPDSFDPEWKSDASEYQQDSVDPAGLPGLRPEVEVRKNRSYTEGTIFKAWLLYIVLTWTITIVAIFCFGMYFALVDDATVQDEQSFSSSVEIFAFLAWIPVSLGVFFLSVKLFLPKAE